LPQHLDPLHVGQAEIENRGVEIFRASEFEAGLAIGRMLDDKTVAAQPIAQPPRKFGIILDQKNAYDPPFRRCAPPSSTRGDGDKITSLFFLPPAGEDGPEDRKRGA
jgi:hypothetical protein